MGNLHLTRQAERALKTTFLEAKLFHKLKVDHGGVKEQFKFMITSDDDMVDGPTAESFPSDSEESNEGKESTFGSASNQKGAKKSKTPVLDNFGRDLTQMAEEINCTLLLV